MTKESLDEQVAQIAAVLPRLLRRLNSLYADDLDMDLPMGQMRVCSFLYDSPESMSALSRELGISLSAITQIADRLERSGMVERVPETEDRRVKFLRLTEKGQEMMRSRRERRKRRISEVLGCLDPDSRQAVLDGLQMFLDAAQRTSADGIPVDEGLL